MQPITQRLLASIFASTVVTTSLCIAANEANAQRSGPREDAPAASTPETEAPTPETDAIVGAMGAVEWGWSRDELIAHFSEQVRKEYRPRIHKARDALTADRIRHELDQQLQRLRDSYVEFDGRTTGHDTSFLRDEFTHRNQESMLRVRSENADDFYFFINNRLWKWYRAFDASVFAGVDFEQFSQTLAGRFGSPGRSRSGVLAEGADPRAWLEWQDDNTRLRALDNNQFYGVYCIVFEHRRTLENLDTLRPNAPNRRRRDHAIVNAVTRGEDHAETGDGNANISGSIRRRSN